MRAGAGASLLEGCNREIRFAIAIEVSNRYRRETGSRGELTRIPEGAIALPEQNNHLVKGNVDDGEIGCSIAIEIARGQGIQILSDTLFKRRL